MRVLLARAGALGDLLLLRRAIAALRRAGHAVTLLAPDAGRVLVGSGGGEVDTHLSWDAPEVATLLGGGRVAEGAFRSAVAACDLALAYSRSVELVHGLARLVPVTVAFDPIPAEGHAAEWFARPIAAVGIDTGAPAPALVPTPDEHEAARPWLERLPARFLAIHPGSGSASKNWPFERFLALADTLAPDVPWLLALGPAEERLARTQHPTPARAVLARDLPLRTLRALFARAGVYVGNDSGATHLAAACGAPTLALFGPTDPEVWAPEGARVKILRATGGDLTTLAVATVAVVARDLPVAPAT